MIHINLPVLIVKREPHTGHFGVISNIIPPREWVKELPQRRHLRFWISISISLFYKFKSDQIQKRETTLLTLSYSLERIQQETTLTDK